MIKTIAAIMIVVFIIGVTMYLGEMQMQHYKEVKEYCDDTYGKNNWTMNETTGTGEYKYYIGQVWECVGKNG